MRRPPTRPSNTCLLSAHSFDAAILTSRGGGPGFFRPKSSPCPSPPDASGIACPSPLAGAGATDFLPPVPSAARRILEGREDGLRRPPAGAGEEGGGRRHRRRAWAQRFGRSPVHVLRLPVSLLTPIRRSLSPPPPPPALPLAVWMAVVCLDPMYAGDRSCSNCSPKFL